MAERTYKEEMACRKLRRRAVQKREDINTLPCLRELSREIELLINACYAVRSCSTTDKENAYVIRNEQLNAVLTLLGMPQVTLTAQDVQTSLLAVGVEIEKYSYGTKLARELRAI